MSSPRVRHKSSKVSFSLDNIDSMDLLQEFGGDGTAGSNSGTNWIDDYSDVYTTSVAPSSANTTSDPTQSWPFKSEDLGDLGDLGDLTDFLDDQLQTESSSGSSTTGTISSDNDFSDTLFDGLGDIKTDIMFSSTIDDVFGNAVGNGNNNPRMGKRRRDVSVTLSECAEGMLALKDMELLLDGDKENVKYGVSPTFGNSFTFMDTPLASSESESNENDEDSDDDDEEIDVVNEEAASSSRTRVHTPKRKQAKLDHTAFEAKKGSTAQPPVKAGRSLLKARPQPAAAAKPAQQPKPTIQQTIDHVNGDHSYFLARPKPVDTDDMIMRSSSAANASNAGVLTPSESGEETDSNNGYNSSTSFYHGYSTLQDPKEVDKSKILKAVQDLAQKHHGLHSRGRQDSDGVKFRFKMRFKSNSPQRAAVAARIVPEQVPQRSLLIQPRPAPGASERVRRKSASRNAHCPPPTGMSTTVSTVNPPTSSSVLSTPLNAGGQTTVRQMPAVKLEGGVGKHAARHSRDGGRDSDSSSTRSSPPNKRSTEDKCREIRDLHNRMERQRRVDLKNNYDQLKDCVPSLQDVDKASKLNILNKAADYCRLLIASDQKLKKDVDRETVRNNQLRKRLQQLVDQQNVSRRMSSGRVSHGAKRFE